MEEIDFGKCANCPKVQRVTESTICVGKLLEKLVNDVMDPSVDEEFAPEAFEVFQEAGYPEDPETGEVIDSPEGIAAFLRKSAAGLIDQVESDENEIQKRVQGITESCGGPLKMRATKDGRTTTVTVCNSPEMSDGVGYEEVHLKREWE